MQESSHMVKQCSELPMNDLIEYLLLQYYFIFLFEIFHTYSRLINFTIDIVSYWLVSMQCAS